MGKDNHGARIMPVEQGDQKMKTLSVKYPWCDKIATGEKTIEVRSWKTDYRGPLLIASSKLPKWELSGKAVCIVDLVDVRPIREADHKSTCLEWANESDYSWVLSNPRPALPIIIKGKLSIYETCYPESS